MNRLKAKPSWILSLCFIIAGAAVLVWGPSGGTEALGWGKDPPECNGVPNPNDCCCPENGVDGPVCTP